MAHHHEPVICPNCGYHATGNYCAQCGQETHLHNETFWGLVAHFIGHYFHYDSKFWQTMKALWFSPGKLTLAYWKNQRMRYISPISLYIFISAVFFIAFYTFGINAKPDKKTGGSILKTRVGPYLDSLGSRLEKLDTTERDDSYNFLDIRSKKIEEEYGSSGKFIIERVLHNIPKLFFFMIPCMALLLKLLFARRKELLFLQHAIFSLHYHSFWFSLFFLSIINPVRSIKGWLMLTLIVVAFVYMILSIRNVYNVSRKKAVLYSAAIYFFYLLLFFIAFIIYLMVLIAMV